MPFSIAAVRDREAAAWLTVFDELPIFDQEDAKAGETFKKCRPLPPFITDRTAKARAFPRLSGSFGF